MLRLKNQQKTNRDKSPKEDTTNYDRNWFDEKSLKKNQLLLTAIHLVTGMKQVNLSILISKTWLIILEIIQLLKYLLKKV